MVALIFSIRRLMHTREDYVRALGSPPEEKDRSTEIILTLSLYRAVLMRAIAYFCLVSFFGMVFLIPSSETSRLIRSGIALIFLILLSIEEVYLDRMRGTQLADLRERRKGAGSGA